MKHQLKKSKMNEAWKALLVKSENVLSQLTKLEQDDIGLIKILKILKSNQKED